MLGRTRHLISKSKLLWERWATARGPALSLQDWLDYRFNFTSYFSIRNFSFLFCFAFIFVSIFCFYFCFIFYLIYFIFCFHSYCCVLWTFFKFFFEIITVCVCFPIFFYENNGPPYMLYISYTTTPHHSGTYFGRQKEQLPSWASCAFGWPGVGFIELLFHLKLQYHRSEITHKSNGLCNGPLGGMCLLKHMPLPSSWFQVAWNSCVMTWLWGQRSGHWRWEVKYQQIWPIVQCSCRFPNSIHFGIPAAKFQVLSFLICHIDIEITHGKWARMVFMHSFVRFHERNKQVSFVKVNKRVCKYHTKQALSMLYFFLFIRTEIFPFKSFIDKIIKIRKMCSVIVFRVRNSGPFIESFRHGIT